MQKREAQLSPSLQIWSRTIVTRIFFNIRRLAQKKDETYNKERHHERNLYVRTAVRI